MKQIFIEIMDIVIIGIIFLSLLGGLSFALMMLIIILGKAGIL